MALTESALSGPWTALAHGGARAYAGLAVRAALSASLFALALSFAPESLDWSQLLALGPQAFILCVALSMATFLLLAWRWRLVTGLLASFENVPGMLSFVRLTWIGLAVNQVLPSIVGGDALRASLLARDGASVPLAAGSVLIDRFYGLAGLISIGLVGIHYLDADLSGSDSISILLACLAGAAVVAVLIVASHRSRRMHSIASAVRAAVSWRAVLTLVPLAALGHLANIATFLIIADALGVGIPILAAAAVLSAVLLVSVLPFSIAGWGIRELSLVQAFSHLDVPHDKIVLASVVYGLFMLVTQALGFLLLVGRSRT